MQTSTPSSVDSQKQLWEETHEPQSWIQRLIGPLYVTGMFWWRIVNFGARWLPDFLVVACAWTLAALSFIVAHKVRAGVIANLHVVLGPTGFWGRQVRIWRTFFCFALCTFDRYTLFYRKQRLRVEFEGGDHWQAALDADSGFIFVTAHYGNLDVGPLTPGSLKRHIHIAREKSVDRNSQRFIERLYGRRKNANFTMHFADAGAGLGTRLLFALRRGEVVALSCDQPRHGQKFVTPTLFDRPTPMPPGPGALARAADVPLVPVYAIRLGRLHYRVIIREPIRVARTDDREADIFAATQQLATHLEWAIRESPHSWYCWWPRWPAAGK